MRFEMANHDLRELLSHALVTNKTYAENLGVTITLQSALSVAVYVDPNRFLQVMANLLSNAAKFSPPERSVEVFANVHGDVSNTNGMMVRISVRDYGPGIPLEFQPSVFGKFCQSDSSDSRSKMGSGLGLAISKALTEAMNGSIGFVTVPNVGTSFYLDFPIAKGTALESEQQLRMISIDLAASRAQSGVSASGKQRSEAI
jgi:signal transduction histidine kinase